MRELKISRINITAMIILCSLGVIIYSNTFGNSFHFDDFAFIVDNPVVMAIGNLREMFVYWPTRFVGFLTFALNYRFHQFEVFGYHLVNVTAHILTSLLVLWLVRLTFSTPAMRQEGISRHKQAISFFVSAIFLTHPVQTEAIDYIFQRVTILAAFFYLASLCLYVKAVLALERNNRINKFYYSASLITALVGILAKENVVTFPLMILLYDSCFLRIRRSIRWRLILPFFILLPLAILTINIAKPIVFTDIKRLLENPSLAAGRYLLTELRVLVTYLRLFLFPVRQNLDYDYPVVQTFWQIPALASISLLALILIVGIRLFSRYRLVSFGLFWFFLTLSPESSIVPLLDPIYEHRLYLPLVGLSVSLVSVLYYFLQNKKSKFAVIILSLVIVLYSFLTYSRNRVWKDEISLWSDVVTKSPGKLRPYNERGLAYCEKGEYDKAIADFTRAVGMNPDYADGFYNRANAYQKQGEHDKAIADFTRAISINPEYAKAYINRGMVYYLNKAYEKAITDFKHAIEISPVDATPYFNLAYVYVLLGKKEEAAAMFNKAIELGYGTRR